MKDDNGQVEPPHPEPVGNEDTGLSPIRRRIIQVIKDSQRNRGYPPSIREIGDAVGLASTSSVSHQLSVLKAKGYLVHEAGRPRTAVLRINEPADTGTGRLEDERISDVPLLGRIAAGVPVLADELTEDVIPLPRLLTGEGSLIALRVAGDSMIGVAIADGDWVVVRRQPDADTGDIVAAVLESAESSDGEATVKTLKKAEGHVWLVPHNLAYSPILADRAVILGKVVSVLRRLLPIRCRSGPRRAATQPSLADAHGAWVRVSRGSPSLRRALGSVMMIASRALSRLMSPIASRLLRQDVSRFDDRRPLVMVALRPSISRRSRCAWLIGTGPLSAAVHLLSAMSRRIWRGTATPLGYWPR